MNDDPIVKEVRSIRDGLARRFNYDIHAIFADLRARERKAGSDNPLVRDAREWEESQAAAAAVREEPPQPGR